MTIKPGWFVLAFLLMYCLVATAAWQRSERTLRAFRSSLSADALTLDSASAFKVNEMADESAIETPLWFPIPGASLPEDSLYLPGAALQGRRGVRQGFEFYGDNAGVPIVYGTPVVATADAVVLRVDAEHQEMNQVTWDTLESELSEREANKDERDALRGRQVWLRTDDARTLRYTHLSATAPIERGERVYKGEVIGYVGNSGTYDGVMNSRRGPRLGFEVWQDEAFFGQNLASGDVLKAASTLFVGR